MRAPHPIPNRPRHPRDCERSQFGWRARCRALALALLIALFGTGLSGCGPLLFEPSPFTPQKVELIYSVQEDITLVRWRISSTKATDPDLNFEILDETGTYRPIDFSQSVFPGGGAPCADGLGTCFQYVVRGAYTSPSAIGTVRSVHAVQGTLPGGRTTARTVQATVSLVSFFHTGNDVVYLNITDSVATDGPYVFPRPYQHAMWPTKGLCVSGSPPDGVGFSPVDATFGFPPPTPLTDDGMYCVGLQPVPADGGPTALVQTRVATLPQVTDVSVTYTPPVEKSPIIYQLVLDLEIPVADNCQPSIDTIERLVSQTMNLAGVPVVQLPTVNLAVDPNATGGSSSCAQPQMRAVDAETIAEAAKQAVSTFPERHQQVHLLYFNNLNAPLPPSLTNSLQTLFDDLSTAPPNVDDLQTLSWLFNPGLAAATGPSWWMATPWQSASDPNLSETLISYAGSTLPYTSQIHDPTVPVPFFTPDQVAAYAGGMFKVCNTTTPFQIVDTRDKAPLGGGPTWPIRGTDPPAYLVYLPTPINAPASTFVPVGVKVDLQVCTKYCADHPYVSTSKTGQLSWSTSALCETTP